MRNCERQRGLCLTFTEKVIDKRRCCSKVSDKAPPQLRRRQLAVSRSPV